MSLPFISVVIPNLHSPIIGVTLESLNRQIYDSERYEVIVVGQDRFGLVQENQRVRFMCSREPLPPSVARNRGAIAATGEILAFLDADCLAHPEWLSVLGERYTDSSVQVVGGAVDFDRDQYWRLSDNISTFHDYLPDGPGDHRSQLPSLNLSIRRALFLEIGGFDERYPQPSGEDADLSLRLRRAGHVLHFERRAVVFHRPGRTKFQHLVHHAYLLGRYSIKLDPRYAGTPDSLPSLLHWRPALILATPLLAAGVVTRIYLPRRALWSLWYTAPAVFIAKLAWCLGAATSPHRQASYDQNYLRRTKTE